MGFRFELVLIYNLTVFSKISIKYTTLETEVKDQLKYCLTVAERDEKVERSCLRTIFNSDFFWN